MAAYLNPAMFGCATFAPRPEASDSAGVVMALETARTLEEQGDVLQLLHWLRRAAEEAAMNGTDQRIVVLTRAAAALATAIDGASKAASPSGAPISGTIPPSDWSEATLPPPAPLPTTPPLVSYTSELAPVTGTPLGDGAIRISAVPVAIPASLRNVSSFVVQRLDGGQEVPPGTVQALLLLTLEIEGILELAVQLREVARATTKR